MLQKKRTFLKLNFKPFDVVRHKRKILNGIDGEFGHIKDGVWEICSGEDNFRDKNGVFRRYY